MFRLLNDVFPVCGKFYSDDRALRAMLEDVVQEFNLQAPRLITFPHGHFHISPFLVGGILDREFHFIFYLQSEIHKAFIDVRCEDTHEHRVALTNIISKYCQADVIETLSLNSPFTLPSGNYANFKAKPMTLGQTIDRITIIGNHLELGFACASFVVPPPGLEERGFDFMQISPDGYFAVHDVEDSATAENFLEVDIFLKREMSEVDLKSWFPGYSEAKFLPRTILAESLF